MKNSRCVAILGSLVLASCAHAGVTVSLTGVGTVGTTINAPTENIFASTERTHNLNGDNQDQALGWRNDPSNATPRRDVAQSFTTGDSSVLFDKITFKVGGSAIPDALLDNANATFTLNIYEMPSASALPTDSGVKLVEGGQQTGSFAGFASGMSTSSGNILATQHNYITFDFSDVILKANTCYSVVLSFTSSGNKYDVGFAHNGNQTYYADGNGFISTNGTSWDASADFYFYASGTAIPEPASVTAIMGGVLVVVAFAWVHFKRNNQ